MKQLGCLLKRIHVRRVPVVLIIVQFCISSYIKIPVAIIIIPSGLITNHEQVY